MLSKFKFFFKIDKFIKAPCWPIRNTSLNPFSISYKFCSDVTAKIWWIFSFLKGRFSISPKIKFTRLMLSILFILFRKCFNIFQEISKPIYLIFFFLLICWLDLRKNSKRSPVPQPASNMILLSYLKFFKSSLNFSNWIWLYLLS